MKKLSDKNKKIFIKCLGILVQPATLMAPIPGVQLIAQGVIYAVSDKLIDSEKPIPDIDTVLSATKENIKQDAILILDQFDNKRELYEDLNFNTDKIANRITDKWCKDHIGQYSDSDKQEIEVAILHYLIEVQRWELSNTAFLQRVLVDHSNRISSVEERLDRQKNEIQTIKLQYEEAAYIGKEKEDSVSVFTANEQYIKSFTDPLFLHNKSGNARVNIANLFVYQKYSLIHDCDNTSLSKEPQKDIVKCIDKFLHQDRKRYLIISGDAGSGKTTLMAWINYHYSLQDLLAKKLFGDRPIITIRLRDIDRKDLSDSQDLVKAILNYMRIDSLSDFDLLFTNAIMILDGFDELCMIEAFNTNHERMLIELRTRFKNNCQFIVTTRPKFINVGLDVPSTFIHLEHFDSNLRTKWLNKYIKAVGDAETIDEKIVDYILNDEGIRTCICDTPMTLYMLMAKKGTDEFLNNNWALYHHIFYEELSETEYNEMFPNDMRDYSHDVVRIKEILYQISEEIAYLMYKKENSKFYLSQEELKGIIKELSKKNTLLENAGIKAIAENCFGICCYWKANKERGVVEFLHNDVRDFFLAEKIYRMLTLV